MGSSPVVYVVDDDESVRKALARLITSAGYRVQTFASACAFLDSDRDAAATACLVLDVRLPDLSGRHVLHLGSDAGAESIELAELGAFVVRDPHAWAMGISAALKPRGYLLLHARHPVLDCLDTSLRWREDYFSWPGVGHVVTAVARAGLQIRRVEELAATDRSHDRQVPSTLVLVAAKPLSAPS